MLYNQREIYMQRSNQIKKSDSEVAASSMTIFIQALGGLGSNGVACTTLGHQYYLLML